MKPAFSSHTFIPLLDRALFAAWSAVPWRWVMSILLCGLVACGGGGETLPNVTFNCSQAYPHGIPPGSTCPAAAAPTPVPTTSVLPPDTPDSPAVMVSVQRISFSWTAVPGATRYRLLQDADGDGPAGPLPYVSLSDTLTATSFVYAIGVHQLVNARYILMACNEGGCSAPSAPVAPDLRPAIGYFKASNPGVNDQFGYALALSADGQTMAVGAWLEDSSSTGVNSVNLDTSSTFNAGAVYVFARVAGVWQQQAYLKASNTSAGDWFGASLALSANGNTLAVGAPLEDSETGGINSMPSDPSPTFNSGAAYVFVRDLAGQWSEQAYVKASVPGEDDGFGKSVALSADGNTLAIGSYRQSTHVSGGTDTHTFKSGAVYVYGRAGINWSQNAFIKAATVDGWDWFGYAVALSADGTVLAISAVLEKAQTTGVNGDPSNNDAAQSGAAYVFQLTAIGWQQQAYIKASNTQAGHRFGQSLALSADGRTLAVGSHLEDSESTGINSVSVQNSATYDAGAVYVFVQAPDGTWSQQAYLKASNTHAQALFGWSLAMAADGNLLAVGAYQENGNGQGMGADPSNNAAPKAGAVYLFERSNGNWTQRSYIKSPNTDANDHFGYALSLSADGQTLAVSARLEDSQATGIQGDQNDNSLPSSGAVYLY